MQVSNAMLNTRVLQSSSLMLDGTQQLVMHPQVEAIFHHSTVAMPTEKCSNTPFLKLRGSQSSRFLTLTRFLCWRLAISWTSFWNSPKPCPECEASLLSAISNRSENGPCQKKDYICLIMHIYFCWCQAALEAN